MRKKPFAISGSEVAARAARRSSHDPPKRSSTSTDIARAPFASYARAISTTSAPGRMSPADGERRLNSAIAPNPGAARASANLIAPLRQPDPAMSVPAPGPRGAEATCATRAGRTPRLWTNRCKLTHFRYRHVTISRLGSIA